MRTDDGSKIVGTLIPATARKALSHELKVSSERNFSTEHMAKEQESAATNLLNPQKPRPSTSGNKSSAFVPPPQRSASLSSFSSSSPLLSISKKPLPNPIKEESPPEGTEGQINEQEKHRLPDSLLSSLTPLGKSKPSSSSFGSDLLSDLSKEVDEAMDDEEPNPASAEEVKQEPKEEVKEEPKEEEPEQYLSMPIF